MDVTLLRELDSRRPSPSHYLPPLSIGLGVILVLMEALYLKTRNPLFQQMTRFWTRIFGLTFALGVATGIVMEFQFGTNWSNYSRFVGDVFGSALAAEGIFAFFLESGFLAILLFGWDKVGPRMHMFSTVMVALGAHFSAVWIVVANSWMQTPAGFHSANALAGGDRGLLGHGLQPVRHDPAGPYGARGVASRGLLGSVGERLLSPEAPHLDFAKASMRIGLVVARVASVASLHHRPRERAGGQQVPAGEAGGHGGASPGAAPAGLSLFGWVDEEAQRFCGREHPGHVELPGAWGCHQAGDRAAGVPAAGSPAAQPVFQAYHAMIGIGMGLIGLSLLGVFLWWRGSLRGPLAAVGICPGGARPPDGEPARLVHRRGRSPTVDRVRPDAHGRRGVAGRSPAADSPRSCSSCSSTSPSSSCSSSCWIRRFDTVRWPTTWTWRKQR